MKRSTAVKTIFGYFILYLLHLIVEALDLKLLESIFSIFINPIMPIILFQREICHFFYNMGSNFQKIKSMIVKIISGLAHEETMFDVISVVKAVQILGDNNTGALIVFTKDAELRYYEESGDLIDGVLSPRLLVAIFSKGSPLHDGAVIIHENKIVAARCILPVTERSNLAAHFGLRHKAAIGLSEVTDALVLIVSEETGQISIAKKGDIESNLSSEKIRNALQDYLVTA